MALLTREMLRDPVIDRSAWKSSELRKDTSWVYELSRSAIEDIDTALQTCSGMPLTSIRQENFPLPSIAADLARLIEEVENGRGFVVVRGLPFGKYDDDQVGRIFWGIGTHLGNAIPQNAQGDLLGHVKAVEGKKYMDKDVRGYQTNAELFFHNDNSDVVGLLCFRKAKAGGVSRITSATMIYNEVLRQHPEFLETICTGFHYDLRGEEREGYSPVTPHRIPIYSYFDGKLSCRYVYTAIMQAAAKGGLTITDGEREAMAFLNETAAREDLCLEMMLEPGDMQFLNNHVILHSRTSFEDFDEPDRRRHMLRLWLNLRNGRKLAPEFSDRYGKGVGMGVLPKDPTLGAGSRHA